MPNSNKFCQQENPQCEEHINKELESLATRNTFLLHVIMISVALLIVVLSMIFHFFNSEDQFYTTVGVAAIGFLFGKFTNSFGTFPSMPKKKEE